MPEPWRQREEWASGWLENDRTGKGAVVIFWLGGLALSAFGWFVMIEASRGNIGGRTEIAPLFPAIGLGMLVLATYTTLEQRKWGRSQLELLTLPGVLGRPP